MTIQALFYCAPVGRRLIFVLLFCGFFVHPFILDFPSLYFLFLLCLTPGRWSLRGLVTAPLRYPGDIIDA
jgi:hypothetical protein